MFAGLTVAMVIGVPSGTFIGQRLDWRAPFFAIAALGAPAATLLHILLPRQIPLNRRRACSLSSDCCNNPS